MGLEQPDLDTPENIKSTTVVILVTGKTGYTNKPETLNIATQSPIEEGEKIISNDPGAITTSRTVFNSETSVMFGRAT